MPSTPPKYNKDQIIQQMIPVMKRGIFGAESMGEANPYLAQNRTKNQNGKATNALGKYQFVPSHHWGKIRDFAKKNGYGDPGENNQEGWNNFLKDEPLQEDFFERYWIPNEIYPKAIELYETYGTKYGLSIDQMGALVHFRGADGASNMLKKGNLDEKMESNNATVSQYLDRYNEQVTPEMHIRPERIFSDDEKKKIVKDFHNKYDAIFYDRTGMSDDVKAMKIQDIWKNAWQKGEYNIIKENVEQANQKIRQKAIEDQKDLALFSGLINDINEGTGDLDPITTTGWGKDKNVTDFGGHFYLRDKELIEKYKPLFEKYPEIVRPTRIKKWNSRDGTTYEESFTPNQIVISRGSLLKNFQDSLNKYKAPDQKIELVTRGQDGSLMKGKDYKTREGFLNGAMNILGSEANTLDLSSNLMEGLDPSRVSNSQLIPVIDINPEWLTPYEAEKKIEEQSTTTPETVAESTQQDAQPTKAILDIQAQEQAPISPTGTLDDWFSMDFDYTQQAPAGDIDYVQPDIPFADIGASLFGIFMGADAAGTDIPMRDEKVGDAVIQYVNDLKRISQQGLSPEEEGYRKQMLKESFSAGVDNIVRASGGNRNTVLGNLGRLDAQMQTGMMDIALQDLQKKQEALFKYGEALQYIDSVDLNRDIANNERLYQDAIATRESGAKLMQGGIATLLDSIQYYKENAPGSANFALKSFYNREAFGYDPNIKDNGLGDTPYTLSYLRKLDSQAKAYQMKNEEAGEMYAALPMETKVQINDFTNKTSGDMDLTYKLIQEAYNNNGELAGGINYGNLVEAQKTGNIGMIIDPNLEKVGTQNSPQYNPNGGTIPVDGSQYQNEQSGIMNTPGTPTQNSNNIAPNTGMDYSQGIIELTPEQLNIDWDNQPVSDVFKTSLGNSQPNNQEVSMMPSMISVDDQIPSQDEIDKLIQEAQGLRNWNWLAQQDEKIEETKKKLNLIQSNY